MKSELKTVYVYDEEGFFDSISLAQPDPVSGEYLMPPNSTFEEPAFKEDFFYKFVNGSWEEIAKPKTASECVALGKVSHYTHTAHDEELRQLFQKLTEGSEEYQITRDDDLSWQVTAKPQKTPEEKAEEAKQQRISELKGLLSSTDYVVIKIAEGEATTEEYAEVLANRKAWREEINQLQGE
jgi:hypothetical protein